MTAREQQADLRPGDVVELRFGQEYDDTAITARGVFPAITDWYDNYLGGPYTFTVVSRAPRLYVNHPRTEPAPGDVVDYSDGHLDGIGPWFAHRAREGSALFWMSPTGPVLGAMPFPMLLLVDGETGLPPAVQS